MKVIRLIKDGEPPMEKPFTLVKPASRPEIPAPQTAAIMGFMNRRLMPYIAGSVTPAMVAEMPQAMPSERVSSSLVFAATPNAAPPCAMLEQNIVTRITTS